MSNAGCRFSQCIENQDTAMGVWSLRGESETGWRAAACWRQAETGLTGRVGNWGGWVVRNQLKGASASIENVNKTDRWTCCI